MSYDFFNRKTVIGRKDHRCEHCSSPIENGERHLYCAGKFDGQFVDYREHSGCYEAWQALHVLRGSCDEERAFLADDDEIDQGERDWLHEKFPVVAVRLWPKQFGRAV